MDDPKPRTVYDLSIQVLAHELILRRLLTSMGQAAPDLLRWIGEPVEGEGSEAERLAIQEHVRTLLEDVRKTIPPSR